MVAKKKADKANGKDKGGATAKAAAEQAIKMIAPKKLLALLGSARAAYKDQRSISGELGAAIKEAAEHDHLHKKAFASVKSSDRMEPEALADFFAHRDYYEETLGLRKRAGSVMRMQLGDEASGETEAPGSRTSNVKPFPLPQGQAAE
jgi:hypothetical protein